MSRAAPASSARHGARGSTSPSTTGENGVTVRATGPHCPYSCSAAATAICAATRRYGVAVARASRIGGRPMGSDPAATIPAWMAIALVMSLARSGAKNVPGTLCAIARRNSPFAEGMARSAATIPAPADSPNTVTAAGSPPNPAMFSATQPSAATTSSSPRLAGAPAIWENPSTPSR
jgi:hypothetical protein